ncbi:MAG: helix-turn-helix domain-containing protein [Clostridiales bacterium]|nr:helix-turn-helix domain-containing protein [Clostridiales bacterium]
MADKILALRGLIYGKFDSETAFAKRLGWSRQRLNKITSGKSKPDIDEVFIIAQGLEEDFETVAQVFLQYWSPKRQLKSVHFDLDESVAPEECSDSDE